MAPFEQLAVARLKSLSERGVVIAAPVVTAIDRFEAGPEGLDLTGVPINPIVRQMEIVDAKRGIKRAGIKVAIKVENELVKISEL